jgi:hypothetical protein
MNNYFVTQKKEAVSKDGGKYEDSIKTKTNWFSDFR